MTTTAKAFATKNANDPLSPYRLERRDVGEHDVFIDILYCGVCHSDIHQVRNEWGGANYPMIPGHEIVGRVKAVGSHVTQFNAGDTAGVGCMVDACRECASCKEDLEQFCTAGASMTYNGFEQDKTTPTFGGYSDSIVVDEKFCLKISPHLSLAQVAPLLCAGITTYSPLKAWGVDSTKKVGIIGLGGLGHMGLKFAHAFGAEVTLFTTSPSKEADARKLGADYVVISKDPSAMQAEINQFDLILDTVSANHDLDVYLQCLKRDGVMVLVGLPENPIPINVGNLIAPRRKLVGSLIGGIKETQEMLDYCAEHNILCDVEEIAIQDVNEAFERTIKGDVKYRFVIDMKSLNA